MKVTTKLTPNQYSGLLAAHRALDGFDRIVKDGDNERVVRQSYTLNFGVRLKLAENIEVLEAQLRRFEAERTKLFFVHAKEGSIEAGTEGAVAFSKAMEEAVTTVVDIDLNPIDFDELGKSFDPYPPSVLSALLVLREEK